MIFLQSLTQSELSNLLAPQLEVRVSSRLSDEEQQTLRREKQKRQSRMRAKQIFNWVYQRYATSWQEMTDLPASLRIWLDDHIEIFRLKEKVSQTSEDGTHKLLWSLDDRKTIESVVIPAPRQATPRMTLCISSQVGCAMACKFCLTGIQGLDRHLHVHEIVSQVWEARMRAPVTNIVFMGMGEPLHNVENVIQACRILTDAQGMDFSKRKVCVSTSGIVPAIDRLGKEIGVNLAISLNGSHDEQRSAVMPVNQRWPIRELIAACQRYPSGAFKRITFEYVLLAGVNDLLEDADRVAKIVQKMPCKVNLIPFNPHPGADFSRPSDQVVSAFQDRLIKKGVTTTVRRSRGRDILAACGQLRSLFGTARGTDRHRDYSGPTSTVSAEAHVSS